MKHLYSLLICLLTCVFASADAEINSSYDYTELDTISEYSPIEKEFIDINYLFTLETERIFFEKFNMYYWGDGTPNSTIIDRQGNALTLRYVVESKRCNEIVDSLLMMPEVYFVKILKTSEYRESTNNKQQENNNENICSDISLDFDDINKRLTITAMGLVSSDSIADYVSEAEEIIFTEGVTGLSDNSFMGLQNLKYVKFPSTLYSFGDYVFSDCDKLSTIDFPKYVESGDELFKFGKYAFKNCVSVDSLYIPSTNFAIYIWPNAFSNCSSLKSIRFGSAYINFIANSEWTRDSYATLENLYIDDFRKWVTDIPARNGQSYLLSSIKNIFIDGERVETSFVIPNGVECIKSECFREYAQPYRVTLPSTIQRIGEGAFASSSYGPVSNGLLSINLPKSLKYIGINVFEGCKKLSEVNIENLSSWLNLHMVKEISFIEVWPFSNPLYEGNAKLLLNGSELSGRIVIPEDVTFLVDYAFNLCDKITELVIPNTIKTVNCVSAFRGCMGTLIVETPKFCYNALASSKFSVIKFSPETVFDTNMYFFKGLPVKEVVLPATLTSIGEAMFHSCTELEHLYIPESVESIGSIAFFNCSKLKSIDLSNITKIGNNTFKNCYSLEEVILSEKLHSIGTTAFSNCNNLRQIKITSDSIQIKNNAFSGCANLNEVYVLSENTPLCGQNERPFYGISSSAILYVPVGCKDKYPENITIDFADVVEIDVTSMKKIIDNTNTSPKEPTYYDLFGRRVEDPQSGLYIQNGKKVYIK